MKIGIVLSVIFIPACVVLILSAIRNAKIKVNKKMSDENFTVMLPSMFITVGAMGALTALIMILFFTFLSDETPDLIFYVIIGLYFWAGIYSIVKALTFRVVVKGKTITVYSFFRKQYSFTFSEIVSAVRQVKDNRVKSERIVIKTETGRRLIVERAEISYKRFLKKVQSEVSNERLVGFE